MMAGYVERYLDGGTHIAYNPEDGAIILSQQYLFLPQQTVLLNEPVLRALVAFLREQGRYSQILQREEQR